MAQNNPVRGALVLFALVLSSCSSSRTIARLQDETEYPVAPVSETSVCETAKAFRAIGFDKQELDKLDQLKEYDSNTVPLKRWAVSIDLKPVNETNFAAGLGTANYNSNPAKLKNTATVITSLSGLMTTGAGYSAQGIASGDFLYTTHSKNFFGPDGMALIGKCEKVRQDFPYVNITTFDVKTWMGRVFEPINQGFVLVGVNGSSKFVYEAKLVESYAAGLGLGYTDASAALTLGPNIGGNKKKTFDLFVTLTADDGKGNSGGTGHGPSAQPDARTLYGILFQNQVPATNQ